MFQPIEHTNNLLILKMSFIRLVVAHAGWFHMIWFSLTASYSGPQLSCILLTLELEWAAFLRKKEVAFKDQTLSFRGACVYWVVHYFQDFSVVWEFIFYFALKIYHELYWHFVFNFRTMRFLFNYIHLICVSPSSQFKNLVLNDTNINTHFLDFTLLTQ